MKLVVKALTILMLSSALLVGCESILEYITLGVEEDSSNELTNTEALPFLKTEVKGEFVVSPVPKSITVQQKKKRFKALLVPPVQKVYSEWQYRFEEVSLWVEQGTHAEEIAALKTEYKAESDHELLAALKPHPPSIVLAQAAMESAWGTSRFFVKAKNVFGVWSFDENEPRVAAGVQRGEKTIWVKKYDSIEDSVRDYYRVLARGFAHQHFRDERLKTDNPYILVKKLDRYSEKKAKYGKELAAIISSNKLAEYDLVFYERPKN